MRVGMPDVIEWPPASTVLWRGGPYQDALDGLCAGLRSRQGTAVLTGDFGTGRTALSRAVVKTLQAEGTIAGEIRGDSLGMSDLLRAVAWAFHLPGDFNDVDGFLSEFGPFLRRVAAQDRDVLLVIDDAHALKPELLLGLEPVLKRANPADAAERAVVNVLLVGDEGFDLELLVGRDKEPPFTVRCHLRPLTEVEVGAYLAHRLAMAGARHIVFSHSAIRAIHAASDGVPRFIELLAQRALHELRVHPPHWLRRALEGAASAQTVDARVVGRAAGIATQRPGPGTPSAAPPPPRPASGRWRPATWAAAVVVLAVALGAVVYRFPPGRSASRPVAATMSVPAPLPTLPGPAAATPTVPQPAAPPTPQAAAVPPSPQPAAAPTRPPPATVPPDPAPAPARTTPEPGGAPAALAAEGMSKRSDPPPAARRPEPVKQVASGGARRAPEERASARDAPATGATVAAPSPRRSRDSADRGPDPDAIIDWLLNQYSPARP